MATDADVIQFKMRRVNSKVKDEESVRSNSTNSTDQTNDDTEVPNVSMTHRMLIACPNQVNITSSTRERGWSQKKKKKKKERKKEKRK